MRWRAEAPSTIRIALERSRADRRDPFRAPPSPSDYLEIAKAPNTRCCDAAKGAPEQCL